MQFGRLRHGAKLLGLATVAVAALAGSRAHAQPGHDAFDKPLGYDNGREERAAHNYLNQTGDEDAYGESQVAPNQSQYGNSNGSQRAGARNQYRQRAASNQNQTMGNDDDAQHHAALGVSLREADGHVTVIAVLPGSPAARAGLQAGDVIRYVGDQRIATAQGLAEEIGEYRPGSQVELSIRRNGEKQTLSARLGSRQSAMRERNPNDNRVASNQNARDGQAEGRRMGYSLNPATGQQRAQVQQRLEDVQQRLSQLQQELNNLKASLNENR